MATLVTLHPDGTETRTPVFKSLTTIGADPDSDVRLADAGLPSLVAHIAYDGKTFTIATGDKQKDILVSGRLIRKQHLVDGDDIVIGPVRLRFLLEERPKVEQGDGGQAREMEAYRRVVAFSKKLGEAREIPTLLEALMDSVISLTNADKGFLVLIEDEEREDGGVARVPRIKMARNLKGEKLDQAVAQLSDSILKRAIETGEAIVVSDALTSTQFSSSESVVSLKLTSVMCVPLVRVGPGEGSPVFGAIYVGNNSVTSLFDDKSLELLRLFAAQASLLVQNALHIDALTGENQGLKTELEKSRYGELIGACDGMREVFKKIDKVARADISVLVTGETGTGKELIARELHKRSPRARGPFVVINCGAIPENLLESELFGHVKGAFTGAVATRPGRFQQADKGTLFLDEIGELPLHLQVKLLRALQDRQVTKIGDGRAEHVDIRVVAATHRNLEQMVKEGTFREDLYYRLNVVQVHLPPLRERGEDVVVLANFLLQKYADEYSKKIKGFSPKALTAIRKYAWPGNVRQLENRLKRAIVLCESKELRPEDLDIQSEDLEDILPLDEALNRFRKRYIDEALERNGGNRTKTARELGVDPRTIFRHLEAARDGEEPGGAGGAGGGSG
ncbi:MAG: sigma-54-dependent Fis family transcriptional regulator [Deltaproteobacteria bacterium]|nr:sigma-54-dependent Fis family transcriptional regulator [Deltaproteobacteria bacterium]